MVAYIGHRPAPPGLNVLEQGRDQGVSAWRVKNLQNAHPLHRFKALGRADSRKDYPGHGVGGGRHHAEGDHLARALDQALDAPASAPEKKALDRGHGKSSSLAGDPPGPAGRSQMFSQFTS